MGGKRGILDSELDVELEVEVVSTMTDEACPSYTEEEKGKWWVSRSRYMSV